MKLINKIPIASFGVYIGFSVDLNSTPPPPSPLLFVYNFDFAARRRSKQKKNSKN